MTAHTASEPAADRPPDHIYIPVDNGAVPVNFVSANFDRRSVIVIGDPNRLRRLDFSPAVVAVEEDGTLSRQLFTDDLEDQTAPPVSFQALEAGTLRLAHALGARQAAILGADHLVDSFATQVIGRQGTKWREAVSTALLGDWVAPLLRGDRLGPEALGHLKTEVDKLHRQLMPLWRRRTRGSRLLLLDTPLGDGLSLYDLLTGYPDPQHTVTEAVLGDARLKALLRVLHPDERAVALAWTHADVATWTEAALCAGAQDPVAFGERVRRKLKRLASRNHDRAAAQTTAVAP
ncbi:hypothetical protein [Actinacidiphila oryziradicis]|uniref:Uncharacterized protein n=1 Tax=Actinacidiphila oryziradicis TaxID=2571141 RepID=A0A4U0RH28_9ACTN|nr:hypothetical protein [Actinacidiphila oryziradicis]TJZ94745.1 hypothetical protein FCI23_53055 [Actinacidiphila oryziradicis]